MTALPAVNKVIRAVLNFTSNANTRVQDRIYFLYSGSGVTVTDLNTLGTTIANAWGTNMSSLQTPSTILTSVQLTDLTTASGAQTQVNTTKAGTGGATTLPTGAAAVIRFKIPRRYRGGHPRFYLPGPPQSAEGTGSSWSATYQGNLGTQFAAFIAACELSPPTNIGVMTHVNVSYFSGFHNVTFPSGRTRPVPTVRVTPVTDTIIAYSGNPNFASQRRRNLQSA